MVDYSDASSLNFPSFAKTFLDLYQKWKEKRKPNNIINTNEKRTIDKYIHINKLKKKKKWILNCMSNNFDLKETRL